MYLQKEASCLLWSTYFQAFGVILNLNDSSNKQNIMMKFQHLFSIDNIKENFRKMLFFHLTLTVTVHKITMWVIIHFFNICRFMTHL